jgi:hypothetical protein
MATTAKKSVARITSQKKAKKEAEVAPQAPALSTLSPREQAKALLEQKTLGLKWQALHVKAKQIPTVGYNMKNAYEKQTAITHKTLGWGFIMDSRNGRLEVLFKDGIKYLISNYK